MTMRNALPCLDIGGLKISPPIIQGGMGVRVSGPHLASAVSNTGALGVLASVGAGEGGAYDGLNFVDRSDASFRAMIRDARAATKNPIAVNIMCALTNYASLVKVAAEERVDAIISGAGLPLKLPSLVSSLATKLIPIVSSARAARLICKSWGSKYGRLPDAIIVEGPLAGGHLGFLMEDVVAQIPSALEKLVSEVVAVVKEFAKEGGKSIPVVAAGGIFDGADIARFLKLGASGVQMGTRFVCTDECDASLEFKNQYVNARPEDITLLKSPVKMPLRVIRNGFVDRILGGARAKVECRYHCLATCEPGKSPYCIAKILLNAQLGNFEAGFAPCGANAHRITKIVSVRALVDELVGEAELALAAPAP